MRTIVMGMALAGSAVSAIPVLGQDTEEAMLTEDEYAEAHAILSSFVDDYRNDPMAISATFGIKIDDRFWTVSAEQVQSTAARGRLTDHSFGPHNVTLSEGEPSEPTWYFDIADMTVLRLIDTGEVNAGTAAMQSFGSDEVGVETRNMEGHRGTSGDQADLYLVMSHFFTRGVPEVTRFGRDNSLETHGAQATALHMMKGFRVLHFSIGPQEVVNEDPRLQYGQMPNLFVITGGSGTLLTDDGPMALEPGMSVFVPPYSRHELINDGEEALEGVLVLYGDNSDFAFGTSYPEFMEDLNQFYREYPFVRTQPGNEEEGE